jgi:hypothetical protein
MAHRSPSAWYQEFRFGSLDRAPLPWTHVEVSANRATSRSPAPSYGRCGFRLTSFDQSHDVMRLGLLRSR